MDLAVSRKPLGTIEPELLGLWAKLDPRAETSLAFHPLLCHLLDTAEVARQLGLLALDNSSPVAQALALPLHELQAWVCFYAALHDLGKASPGFQAQDIHISERLSSLSATEPLGVKAPPHGLVTAWALPDILTSDFGHPPPLATQIGLVTGGHHGIFPTANDRIRLHSERVGGEPWQAARRRIVRVLSHLLGLPDNPPASITHPVAMILSGLISVADWIASNEKYFPYAASDRRSVPQLDLVRYLAESRVRAQEAIDALGWFAPTPRPSPRLFSELFGYTPRSLQQAAAELAPRITHPALIVVEAPMGEGKTEAALLLAEHLSCQAQLRGLYFALPTQATSNQMFSRLTGFLAKTSPDPKVQLQLLHGHASLSAEFEVLRKRSLLPFESSGIQDGRANASVVASEWFTFRKRGLLAGYGVGTVDQILLAALQTRHVFVRSFGLAGKVVVIDEVHAYDTYMSALLERLLAWLAALGTSVVLLSATLPSSRRAALLLSYARGLGVTPTPQLPAASYPRIAFVARELSGARTFPASGALRKTIKLHSIERSAVCLAALAARLNEALRDGGCAVVVCNTVARAQQVYSALKPLFPGLADDGLAELDLLHSRFLFEARQRREDRSLRRFGPPSSATRPARAVLVATQIVEQSLDLDFDLLVSDLAPIDLVLQRAGRLHRHSRIRPAPLAEPQIWLLMPPLAQEPTPAFERADQHVYESHILFRTWLALNNRESLDLPADIEELVESVYDDRDSPTDLHQAARHFWEQTRDALHRVAENDRQEAQLRWLKPPWADCGLDELTQSDLEEDSPEFHRAHQALTRLADVSVPVVFLYDGAPHPSLDPEGTQFIDLSQPPDLALTRQLLRRSVTLTDRRIVHALLEHATPAGWRKTPLLRNHRHLCLNKAAEVGISGYRIRLDDDLGVVLAKEENL